MGTHRPDRAERGRTMSWLSWIFFGALAGWVASLVLRDKQRGCLTNMATGILGAVLGGIVINSMLGGGRSGGSGGLGGLGGSGGLGGMFGGGGGGRSSGGMRPGSFGGGGTRARRGGGRF